MVRILQELKEDGQAYAADLLFQVGIWFCSRNDSRPLSKLSSMNVMPRLVIDDAIRHQGEISSTSSVAPLVAVGWGGLLRRFSILLLTGLPFLFPSIAARSPFFDLPRG